MANSLAKLSKVGSLGMAWGGMLRSSLPVWKLDEISHAKGASVKVTKRTRPIYRYGLLITFPRLLNTNLLRIAIPLLHVRTEELNVDYNQDQEY